ncbi:hypothetical protein MHYMCMPSP_00355 [Hyalomma marginatum]|uniref:Uncharacterized protein n=1 Tax=Hyalomma marginatum TaxID=34627 RepID=A0A8S4BTL6_9ACAR|nr:hypothetical protein MHYMCMPASI_00119 [Hyalomma marginatum]CAG7590798.1 hypothetical protein MHYMCMPSP_00355 [Hyalomma marginatum]
MFGLPQDLQGCPVIKVVLFQQLRHNCVLYSMTDFLHIMQCLAKINELKMSSNHVVYFILCFSLQKNYFKKL